MEWEGSPSSTSFSSPIFTITSASKLFKEKVRGASPILFYFRRQLEVFYSGSSQENLACWWTFEVYFFASAFRITTIFRASPESIFRISSDEAANSVSTGIRQLFSIFQPYSETFVLLQINGQPFNTRIVWVSTLKADTSDGVLE